MHKTYSGYMLYDWKSNKAKITTRYDKRKLGPYTIPLKINLKIEIPEIREFSMTGSIKIPAVMVEDLIVEETIDTIGDGEDGKHV